MRSGARKRAQGAAACRVRHTRGKSALYALIASLRPKKEVRPLVRFADHLDSWDRFLYLKAIDDFDFSRFTRRSR